MESPEELLKTQRLKSLLLELLESPTTTDTSSPGRRDVRGRLSDSRDGWERQHANVKSSPHHFSPDPHLDTSRDGAVRMVGPHEDWASRGWEALEKTLGSEQDEFLYATDPAHRDGGGNARPEGMNGLSEATVRSIWSPSRDEATQLQQRSTGIWAALERFLSGKREAAPVYHSPPRQAMREGERVGDREGPADEHIGYMSAFGTDLCLSVVSTPVPSRSNSPEYKTRQCAGSGVRRGLFCGPFGPQRALSPDEHGLLLRDACALERKCATADAANADADTPLDHRRRSVTPEEGRASDRRVDGVLGVLHESEGGRDRRGEHKRKSPNEWSTIHALDSIGVSASPSSHTRRRRGVGQTPGQEAGMVTPGESRRVSKGADWVGSGARSCLIRERARGAEDADEEVSLGGDGTNPPTVRSAERLHLLRTFDNRFGFSSPRLQAKSQASGMAADWRDVSLQSTLACGPGVGNGGSVGAGSEGRGAYGSGGGSRFGGSESAASEKSMRAAGTPDGYRYRYAPGVTSGTAVSAKSNVCDWSTSMSTAAGGDAGGSCGEYSATKRAVLQELLQELVLDVADENALSLAQTQNQTQTQTLTQSQSQSQSQSPQSLGGCREEGLGMRQTVRGIVKMSEGGFEEGRRLLQARVSENETRVSENEISEGGYEEGRLVQARVSERLVQARVSEYGTLSAHPQRCPKRFSTLQQPNSPHSPVSRVTVGSSRSPGQRLSPGYNGCNGGGPGSGASTRDSPGQGACDSSGHGACRVLKRAAGWREHALQWFMLGVGVCVCLSLLGSVLKALLGYGVAGGSLINGEMLDELKVGDQVSTLMEKGQGKVLVSATVLEILSHEGARSKYRMQLQDGTERSLLRASLYASWEATIPQEEQGKTLRRAWFSRTVAPPRAAASRVTNHPPLVNINTGVSSVQHGGGDGEGVGVGLHGSGGAQGRGDGRAASVDEQSGSGSAVGGMGFGFARVGTDDGVGAGRGVGGKVVGQGAEAGGVGREGQEGRRAGEEERKAHGVVENGDAGRDAGRELVSKVIRYSMRYGGGLMCLLFLDVILFA